MGQIGIDIRDPSQAVGTMSGGERQCLAISRAIYFGAKVLVLDEPTSALGVHQASVVLKYIVKAASQGLAVILITHNVHHAYPVGNSFTVLNRGRSLGTYEKKNIVNDVKKLTRKISNVEIGMFSIILTGVAMEEGLNISYTACLNANKLIKKYDWLKKEEVEPTLALSLGYERPDTEDKVIKRGIHHILKGVIKPEKHQTFEWI